MPKKIFKANSESELVKTLQTIHKHNKFQGFNTGNKVTAANIEFGKESKNHAKYGWTNAHSILSYDGEFFDVKSSKLMGTLGIRLLRPVIEELYNDGFLEYQSIKDSIKQEKEVYARLNKLNFPTLTLRNDIIPGKQKIDDKVIITELIEQPSHLIDAIKESVSIEGKLSHIQNAAQTLGHLHSHNQLSGDPAIQNFMYDGNVLLAYDFETKINPDVSFEEGKTNDFIQFTLNAIGHSKLTPDEVVQAALKGYQPSLSQKQKLLPRYIRAKFPKNELFRESFYTKPIHAMNVETEKETYKIILDSI